MRETAAMKGDRVILIDSPGGYVAAGGWILRYMQFDKAVFGTKFVCVVTGSASSMAFNILSFCDTRLAVQGSYSLVHKIFISGLPPELRLNAKDLAKLRRELLKMDEPYRQQNALAMHLSLKDYDRFADKETVWPADKLLEIKYLSSLVSVDETISKSYPAANL